MSTQSAPHVAIQGTPRVATRRLRRWRPSRSWQIAVDIVREATTGLLRNRMRAGLSMLGISWGIVSVVMLLAYGEGFNQAILRGFKGAFGDGVTIMFAGQTSNQAGGERAGKAVRLRMADAEAVGELPLVKAWSPEFMTDVNVAYGTKQATYRARGVASSYGVMRSETPAAGRFIDTEDLRLQRH